MSDPSRPPVLVCFAVEPEARPFRRRCRAWASATAGGAATTATTTAPAPDILLTGIGPRNAAAAIRRALAAGRPALVISAGFAGGLNPTLERGAVVMDPGDAAAAAGYAERWRRAGARPGRFHCAERIAATAAAKQALWRATGADAVEMESGVIRAVCAEHGVPSAVVRVVSDTAQEDLPLDFNAVFTADYRLDPLRLAAALVRAPGRILGLMRFRRMVAAAADRLAVVLAAGLGTEPPRMTDS